MAQPSPETERDHAGVIVPPPLIYGGVLALALIIDIFAGRPSLSAALGLPVGVLYAAGALLIAIGFLLAVSALRRFSAAGTEVPPWKPSTVLVANGPYRFTRNPMYLGLTLLYAGLSLFADSIIALVCLVPLLAVIRYGVIKREEHYLEVKFGEPYRTYKRKVRRWL